MVECKQKMKKWFNLLTYPYTIYFSYYYCSRLQFDDIVQHRRGKSVLRKKMNPVVFWTTADVRYPELSTHGC